METGDDGTTAAGSLQVQVDYCPDPASMCIEFDSRGGVNDAITRAVNLDGATSATLTFDYRVHTILDSAEFVLEVSADGGANWNSLASYNTVELVFGETIDLTPYISADTQIRFRLNDKFAFYLFVDNVEIWYGDTPEPSTALLLGSGLAGLAAWRRRRGPTALRAPGRGRGAPRESGRPGTR